MSYWKEFIQRVDQNREGEPKWIPLPYDRLSNHVGIKDYQYTLIGGDSGTGKSAFTTLSYVLHPFQWLRNNSDSDLDFHIIVRSMERDRTYTLSKWACWWMYHKYNILMDTKDVFSWGRDRTGLPDGVYEKLKEGREFFEELQEKVTIINGPDNPTGVWKHMNKIAEEEGKIARPNKHTVEYKPHNPNKIILYIIDHIGKLRTEKGYSRKENTDKMSDYLTLARDRFGFSPVVVSQFNRSLSDTTRRTKLKMQPNEADFKNSSNMFEDADVALALFNPYRYHIEKSCGYAVNKFVYGEYNRFRTVHLLKNHFGSADLSVGMNFIGEIGEYRELPKPQEMTTADYKFYTQLPDAKVLGGRPDSKSNSSFNMSNIEI